MRVRRELRNWITRAGGQGIILTFCQRSSYRNSRGGRVAHRLCNLVAQVKRQNLSHSDLDVESPGANLDNGGPQTLLFSMTRFFKFLPGEQRQAFWEVPHHDYGASRPSALAARCAVVTKLYVSRCCVAMVGCVNRVAPSRTWKSTTNSFAATRATIQKKTRSHCVYLALKRCIPGGGTVGPERRSREFHCGASDLSTEIFTDVLTIGNRHTIFL